MKKTGSSILLLAIGILLNFSLFAQSNQRQQYITDTVKIKESRIENDSLFNGPNSRLIVPKFNKDLTQIIEEIKKSNYYEKVNLKWTVFSMDQKYTHFLKLFLINGKKLPKTEELLYKLGKEAMGIILKSIDNKNEFDSFIVLFIKSEKTGVLTLGTSTPFEYSLNDFEQ